MFQYCFVRVFFTIVAVLAEAGGVYCEESLSPKYAHVWVQVCEAISVTVAMFCLIQFYIQLKDDLAEHRPFLKVLCIKLVIFFSFWQTVSLSYYDAHICHSANRPVQIVISFASSDKGPLQPTKYLAYPDIKVGIPSVLLCIEMSIFAVMHIFAFCWKPYSLKHSYADPLHQPGGGLSGGADGASNLRYKGFWYALFDAFNPWDIIKMTARGFRWLFIGHRKRFEDVSYQDPTKPGVESSTGYGGATYARSGGRATELRPSGDDGLRRDTWEDDRAGLLRNSNQLGTVPTGSSYRPYDDVYTPADGSEMDLSVQNTRAPRLPQRPGADLDMKPSEFDDDTDYHPRMGPAAGAGRADPGGVVHPAHRPDGSGGWPLSNDVESVRSPPSYRTDDSYR